MENNRQNSILSVVGKKIPKVDGIALVTGEAKFAADYRFLGMLFGRVLRSSYPSAIIKDIDISKAEKFQGVRAIITCKDVPCNLYGVDYRDQPTLAKDRVRTIGDPIAAVAAENEDIAEEALDLIEVEYEELPILSDTLKAMKADSFKIQDNHEEGNIFGRKRIIKGDIDKGLDQADFVFKDSFRTPFIEHASIEPHAVTAIADNTGKVTIWTSTQYLSRIITQVAGILQLPLGKIEIIQAQTGGGFGGKIEQSVEAVCALLAMKTRRPVTVSHTRREEFVSSTVRHPYYMDIETGVSSHGRIVAQRISTILDTGAYSSYGEVVAIWSNILASGPYEIPNIQINSCCVNTNQMSGGAFRGLGNNQVTFGREMHLDRIAKELNMDPVEFRLINGHREGSITATSQILKRGKNAIGFCETLEAAAEASNWKDKNWKERTRSGKRRGIGVACVIHGSGAAAIRGTDSATCFMKMNYDGSASLVTGAVDIGQGSDTTLSQIAAETLGIAIEDITITSKGTYQTPHDGGTVASRIVYLVGNAVKKAAEGVRKQLIEVASEQLEANPDDLEIKDRKVVVKGSPSRFIPIGEVVMTAIYSKGFNPAAIGRFSMTGCMLDENGHGTPIDAYLYGTHIAEVEVDVETGKVDILRIVAAHDVGKAINPMIVEGQIEGGVTMGIGSALYEQILMDKGIVLNPNFTDYKIPTSLDIPKIEPIIVESMEPSGPFGAKGVGEPAMSPTAPAIANAIYDAIGVRFHDIPITPEKVMKALKSRSSFN